MAKTIAIANQKGGVGKTTTSVNLAACLAAMQFRTLLVDLDPQGNASSGVGCERQTLERSVYDALCRESPLREVVIETGVSSLWLVPATIDLAAAEVELVNLEGRNDVLVQALAPLQDDFDYIIIDCPPSLSILTINALVASDSVLVPIQAEYYALEGLARLLDTVEQVRTHLNPRLQLEGLVLTMFDARNNLARQVENEVREHFAEATFQTVIPRNVRLAESPSFGEPIIMYDIRSIGATSYLDLAREFMERQALREAKG